MPRLDISDHRAVRTYLAQGDYALAEGAPYVPEGKISPEAWAALTGLPDNVLLITTDRYSSAIPILQRMAFSWLDIHDGIPEDSPMRLQCLVALEGLEGALFNAVNGWYRLAGMALRCIVEDVLIGLYYHCEPTKRAEFEAVTSGRERTPSRGEINSTLSRFTSAETLSALNTLYANKLSVYVHRTSEGSIWESNGPIFVREQMELWIGQVETTYRLLCALIDEVIPGCGIAGIAEAIQFDYR